MVTNMNIGGVEKSLLSLLSAIPKDKYDITLILLEKKGGFLESIPNWVKIEESNWFSDVKPIIMQPPQQTVKNFLYNKQFLKIPSFINAYFISKYFNNRHFYYQNVLKSIPNNPNKYDIAISYQGPTDIIDYYIAYKVTAHKKISWVHFDVSKHRINEKLYKKLYRSFEKVFVVSKQAKNNLIDKVPSLAKKTEVFMNIIPKDLIKEMSQVPIKFDDDYRGLKIVTVGRLSKEKGQDMAIKVLSRLRDEGYEVRWYCIGEGNERKEYEQLIHMYGLKNDFVLLGAKTNPYPYIFQADIYVQTSRHEGYCITLAEAKYLKKPIVTSNFIGAYEQIENDVTGIIVSNEEELYSKIKYIIDHKREREKLSKALEHKTYESTDEIQKFLTYIS
ncbi:glycosyltransferase [Bacillus sp. FJAT-49754]|uniref:Glycosyltransferase n=2 Tax=Lederbergia citrea TaxID=2833581 RepID=A0A942Z745_9BACI|nr:glycosyltransferase [Lederbergia citrea]MBS4224746.1 glycosyltransferase [Lederbergia citrea]